MNIKLACFLSAATVAACGSTFSADVTYYACGGGTKNNFSYDWGSTDNWRLDGATGTQIPGEIPQEDDIVVFDKLISYMSAAPDGNVWPALHKIVFNVNATIHQGLVCLKAGGEGLWMKDGIGTMTWWAGLRFVGNGEVPVHIPSGCVFNNQKGVFGNNGNTTTLIKTGGGTFVTAYQNKASYLPRRTILLGGTFAPRVDAPNQQHEFIWGSNDANLRLLLKRKDSEDDVCDWTINNGAMIESNVVANTTHGINTDSAGLRYLRLTGTPKLAEQRFTGQLYGNAGIAFTPGAKQGDGSDYVFTIAESSSSGGGGLIVSNGTMRLVEGATLSNLQLVSVANGGTFAVEEGSGTYFFSNHLELTADAKLQLGTGVWLTCGRLTVGGQKLGNGTYSATGADGSVQVDWIEGDGCVQVSPIRYVNPIVLTVGESETMTLEEAVTAYNAAHGSDEGFTAVSIASLNGGDDKGRTLVKEGKGTLVMDTAISGYIGGIDAKEGFLKCGCKYAFGADVENSHVNIQSGAAVIIAEMSKENRDFNVNRTFHVAGTGPDGQGALRSGNTLIDYGTRNVFGNHLIVEDDALVRHGTWYYLPNKDVTLNGHTLTYKPMSGTDVAVFFEKVNDNGKLVMDGSANRQPGFTFVSGDEGNVVECMNYGGWRFWGSNINGDGKSTWQYNFTAGECRIYGDNSMPNRDSGNNTFWSPMNISAGVKVAVRSQGNTSGGVFYVRGPVSGEGGFEIPGDSAEPGYLHLMNPANDFTGAVTVDRGIVDVYEAGTLPKAATLMLNRVHTYGNNNKESHLPAYYGAAFVSSETQDLGACVLKGDWPGRVQGGIGRFESVVKSGQNTIEYYSQLGGGVLDVEGGVLKLPRGAAPGLWEASQQFGTFENARDGWLSANPANSMVLRGPHSANQLYYENYTLATSLRVIIYTGYIWNRTGADATWTFVSSVNGPVQIKIDDEDVLTTGDGGLFKVQKLLTPGPHKFSYRAYNGTPRSTGWVENAGFMYDVNGAKDPAATDCQLCIDPGDGSLFTRSTDPADLPAFDAIRIGAGGTLDVNGNRFVANDIGGAGEVSSSVADASAALVAKAMTLNAGADETLTVKVPFVFGDGFKINVTNVAHRVHKRHTILKAAAVLADVPSALPVIADDGSFWTASISADGTAIEVCRTGLTVILR